MRVESQQAYVLHTREYRDTSLLVELMTAEYGRVSGVARGVRNNNKSSRARRSVIQPFAPLFVSWSGRGDLKTLTHFEFRAFEITLQGKCLFSGMYINELLTRLLQHYDEQSEIYTLYEWVLKSLPSITPIDITLRRFELQLLENLGYGYDFTADIESGELIKSGCNYLLDPRRGFIIVRQERIPESISMRVFKGEDIIALAAGEFTTSVRKSAKRLCRQALREHLGNKPLKSRELFG